MLKGYEGMRRVVCSLICACIVLSALCGCAKERSKTNEVPMPDIAETGTTPDSVEDILNRYKKWCAENFETARFSVSNIASKDDKFYNFTVQTAPDADFGQNVSFYINEGVPEKSFSILFPQDYDMASLRSYIIATICVTDTDIELQAGTEEMERLVASYDGTGPSKIYQGSEYNVFIAPGDVVKGHTVVASYKAEENVSVEKNNYEELEFEAAKTELNKDRNAVVSGSVKTVEWKYPTASIGVEDIDGNRYSFYCSFTDIINGMEVDGKYLFYVKLLGRSSDGVAYAFLDYFEIK